LRAVNVARLIQLLLVEERESWSAPTEKGQQRDKALPGWMRRRSVRRGTTRRSVLTLRGIFSPCVK
jgi:predicted transcriptional regulator